MDKNIKQKLIVYLHEVERVPFNNLMDKRNDELLRMLYDFEGQLSQVAEYYKTLK